MSKIKIKTKVLLFITILLTLNTTTIFGNTTYLKNNNKTLEINAKNEIVEEINSNPNDIQSTIEVLPCLQLSLSSNSIDFGQLNITNNTGYKDIVATINTNISCSLNTSGTDLIGTGGTIPISNISASLYSSEYKSLSTSEVSLAEKQEAAIDKEHTIRYKLNLPTSSKSGNYNGEIKIVASNDSISISVITVLYHSHSNV